MRGPVLLLSRKPSTSPDVADNVIVLSSTTLPSAQGSRAATVGSSCTKIRFATTAVRDAFMAAAKDAVASSGGGGIDRYDVRHELRHGSSWTVYLVQSRRDGTLFAMKAVPKADAFFSDAMLSNLVAERAALADAASRQSAFIVKLVDAFETATHLCLVTELGHFGRLSDVLQRVHQHRLVEEIAKKLFAEVVLGLDESHRMGYLYREMQPASLLLNRFGHIRLAEFGSAKKVKLSFARSSVTRRSKSGSRLTSSEDGDEPFRLLGRTNSFVGTRRYMSPEQLKGRQNMQRGYGAPADVWAMGVTLYNMLTGDHPFARKVSSRNSAAMFSAIQNEEIAYPKWLSDEAVSMLRGLLDRDPLERLEISEITVHPWMKNIDWKQLKFDSSNDVPQDEILSVLRGIQTEQVVCASVEKENKNVVVEEDMKLSVSRSSSEWSKERRTEILEGDELLGFGYHNKEYFRSKFFRHVAAHSN